MFSLYFSSHAMQHLNPDFIVSQVRQLFQSEVKRFETLGLPGEFDRFGGPKGAVVYNLRLALSRCPNKEIRQHLIEAIPELAT